MGVSQTATFSHLRHIRALSSTSETRASVREVPCGSSQRRSHWGLSQQERSCSQDSLLGLSGESDSLLKGARVTVDNMCQPSERSRMQMGEGEAKPGTKKAWGTKVWAQSGEAGRSQTAPLPAWPKLGYRRGLRTTHERCSA